MKSVKHLGLGTTINFPVRCVCMNFKKKGNTNLVACPFIKRLYSLYTYLMSCVMQTVGVGAPVPFIIPLSCLQKEFKPIFCGDGDPHKK